MHNLLINLIIIFLFLWSIFGAVLMFNTSPNKDIFLGRLRFVFFCGPFIWLMILIIMVGGMVGAALFWLAENILCVPFYIIKKLAGAK